MVSTVLIIVIITVLLFKCWLKTPLTSTFPARKSFSYRLRTFQPSKEYTVSKKVISWSLKPNFSDICVLPYSFRNFLLWLSVLSIWPNLESPGNSISEGLHRAPWPGDLLVGDCQNWVNRGEKDHPVGGHYQLIGCAMNYVHWAHEHGFVPGSLLLSVMQAASWSSCLDNRELVDYIIWNCKPNLPFLPKEALC